MDPNKRVVLIFHCEFSSERGPKLSRFLRSKDRLANKECYPNLFYPELYLLEGGYKNFFETHKVGIFYCMSCKVRKNTFLTCTSNEDTVWLVLHYQHEETLYYWLSNMHPVKIQIRLQHWGYMLKVHFLMQAAKISLHSVVGAFSVSLQNNWILENMSMQSKGSSQIGQFCWLIQSPVVQSIVCLTGLLVVKMLTVLVSISKSQVFLLKKCE